MRLNDGSCVVGITPVGVTTDGRQMTFSLRTVAGFVEIPLEERIENAERRIGLLEEEYERLSELHGELVELRAKEERRERVGKRLLASLKDGGGLMPCDPMLGVTSDECRTILCEALEEHLKRA